MSQCQFGLALECLHHAKDYSGLLLLATSAGDAGTLAKLAETTSEAGKNNIAFSANFLLGRFVTLYTISPFSFYSCNSVFINRLEVCLDILISTSRLAEAALFARTYLPSQISR